MRWHFTIVCVMLMVCVAVIVADESSVQFDEKTSFSVLRTFFVRAQQIESRRVELDNPLFLKMLTTAIRRSLVAKGLVETRDRPDLVVDFTVTGEEFGDAQRKLLRGAGPGGPVRTTRPIRLTEGTLVIDIYRRDEAAPFWRGVYRDDERIGSKLVNKLPEDAKKLLGRYPRLTK